MTLRATGTKDGKTVSVEYSEGEFLFNKKHNSGYEQEILREVKRRHAFGGTYYPEETSDINIINVIGNYFFDRNVAVHSEDAEIGEIESETGRIY